MITAVDPRQDGNWAMTDWLHNLSLPVVWPRDPTPLGYVSLLTGALGMLFLGLAPAVQLLMILMLADFVLGMTAAVVEGLHGHPHGGLHSRAAWLGLIKKCSTLGIVFMFAVVQRYVPVILGGDWQIPFATGITGAYCVAELISILENANRAGVKVPAPLLALLHQLDRGVSPFTLGRNPEDKGVTYVFPAPTDDKK